jgi:hypothetical protein
MRHRALTLRRLVWVACVGMLLLPRLAAAAPSRAIDLDGDGQNDRFALDHRDASLLSIWLSASNTVQVIHSQAPLEQVVAADLDGDRQPELVARDSKSHLHIWTRKSHGFHPYRLHPVARPTIGQPNHRAVDNGDDDAPGAITDASLAPCALLPRWSPRAFRTRAPAPRALSPALRTIGSFRQPFAPRPPPALTLS